MRQWRSRAVLLLALLVITVITAAGAWLYQSLLKPGPDRPAQIEIEAGTSASRILQQLEQQELLPSVLAGRLYLLLRGHALHYGHYRVPARARPFQVLEQLLAGRVETIEVTIIEGSDLATVSRRFIEAGIGDEQRWAEVTRSVAWVADLAPGVTTLEGFLFPETYRFSIGTRAETAAHHMVDRFLHVWQEETNQLPGPPWGTPLEVLTLASLIEGETSVAEERARIAGVFLNRLRLGMLLQCDPTVVYALKQRGEWQGRLLRLHWQLDHPYNTYRYPGLPPGPISSPGQAALSAALQPEESSYLYFVASPGGGHSFSRTLKEHNRAVALLRRSRR